MPTAKEAKIYIAYDKREFTKEEDAIAYEKNLYNLRKMECKYWKLWYGIKDYHIRNEWEFVKTFAIEGKNFHSQHVVVHWLFKQGVKLIRKRFSYEDNFVLQAIKLDDYNQEYKNIPRIYITSHEFPIPDFGETLKIDDVL